MLDLLRKRRSVRRFLETPVPAAVIAGIEEALLRSPSSRSIRPWHFVLVDDPTLLARLAKAKHHGASFLARAPLAVGVCGLPEESDVWIEDCTIASLLVQLYVESVPGMGSCWVQIRNRRDESGKDSEACVREVINLPSSWSVESIVAVGYEAERPKPVDAGDLLRDRVHRNRRAR